LISVSQHKTKVVKNSLNASWDEEFCFQGNGELTVTVMDWDMLSKDEVVGSASLSIKDYLASGSETFDSPRTP
jgi:Ca2+-dependent lipid-binding protein